MRRGLISRSLVELPDAVFDARLERTRAAMWQAQCDALVIYTNNTRPAGASWLAGFVPYWSEALLVVPREATPYLVAALSFRVKSWIERVSRIGEVLHTPRIGLKAAQKIAAACPNAVTGIVDFDGLPAGIAEDMREGGPGLTVCDANAWFAPLRAKADPAEIALAMKAAAIANCALCAAPGDTSLNEIIAVVERVARNLGAEEIYIAAASDLQRDCRFRRIEGESVRGKSFALRATVAYKGTWVRLVRAFADPTIERQAATELAKAVAHLPSDRGFSGFASWLVEGCRATQPLEALLGSRLGAAVTPPFGSLVSVQGVLAIDGCAIPVGAPALIGAPGEPAVILCAPSFN
jgi:Creatinase/Prolidase N-terminal domain